jgi:hypothetical protein
MDEDQLLRRLAAVEALHAGAGTPGEREAAAAARDRIRARLEKLKVEDPPVEHTFSLTDGWSRRLLLALMRRYGLKPYRYPRQRRTTVRAKVPRRFVDEVLWPQYLQLSKLLHDYLSEATDRVIALGLQADASEAEETPEPAGNIGPQGSDLDV